MKRDTLFVLISLGLIFVSYSSREHIMILTAFDTYLWQEHIMASAEPVFTHSFTGFSAVLTLHSTLMRGAEELFSFREG